DVDARLGFDLELRDGAVLDDRRVALRPRAETEARAVELETHGPGELAAAVGQHRDVGAALRLGPRVHHPRVVHGDARDGVDALGLELVGVGDVAGQVDLR